MTDRSVTFKIKQTTYLALRKKAIERAAKLGKCVSVAAIAKEMVQEAIKRERRERRDAKKRSACHKAQDLGRTTINISEPFSLYNTIPKRYCASLLGHDSLGYPSGHAVHLRDGSDDSIARQTGKKNDVVTTNEETKK